MGRFKIINLFTRKYTVVVSALLCRAYHYKYLLGTEVRKDRKYEEGT